MKQKLVGTYELGFEYVQLIAILDDNGGCFYFQPEKNSIARIKVGLEYDRWYEVVGCLLHEAFEFAFTRHGLRFIPCRKFNGDHANYLFAFDHPQYTQICSEVSLFVASALPELASAYRKHRKKSK